MAKKMLKKIKEYLEKIIFYVMRLFPLNDRGIVFESERDFTDNSYALFDYMESNGFFETYNYIWIADTANEYYKGKMIPKITRYISLRRLYYLATYKYYIFDHNNILASYPMRKDQVIINLFHGCSFKSSKGANQHRDTECMLLVTSDFWKPIMSRFIPCKEEIAQSLGFPRNDYLFTSTSDIQFAWTKKMQWEKYKKIFLWMPTFRKSNSPAISEDYYDGNTGLPIIESSEELIELNEELKKMDACLVFKIHHLQAEYDAFKTEYSNIQYIKDEMLEDFHIQLYQVVALTDALITDYSSIFNDYILIDKPMIFTLDDYEEYRKSRGFAIDDPAQYFPGYHVFTKEELFNAIREIADDKDTYKSDRDELLPILHKFVDGNSSKRIVDYFGFHK